MADNLRPRIVTLCGSTRFADLFREANLRETLADRMVFSIGCNMRSDAEVFGDMDEAELAAVKKRLDALHKEKIRASDEILVLSRDGYIGPSTRSEIRYAISLGKHVRWWEDEQESERS